jgi:hypothetical protein
LASLKSKCSSVLEIDWAWQVAKATRKNKSIRFIIEKLGIFFSKVGIIFQILK